MRLFFFLIVCLALSPAIGQQSTLLDGLRSKGNPPVDFRTDILFKSHHLHDGWEKIDLYYRLQMNAFMNEILSSGKIVYGDTITSLINKLADGLLATQPEVRKQLRFYTLRSTVPNAMCFPQGIVLVSTALIAQVHNQNELAYVLAHEVSHYTQRHSLFSYKFRQDLAKSNNNNKQSDLDELIRSFYTYSQQNESAADSIGFLLYKAAGFPPTSAPMALLRLKDWDHYIAPGQLFESLEHDSIFIPGQDTSWSMNIMESTKSYVKLFIKKQHDSLYENPNEKLEVYQTHPALRKRIARLMRGLDTTSYDNAIPHEYNYYRTLATFDVAYRCYLLNEFAKTLYLTDILYREGIRDEYTRLLRDYSIYHFVRMSMVSPQSLGNNEWASSSENENKTWELLAILKTNEGKERLTHYYNKRAGNDVYLSDKNIFEFFKDRINDKVDNSDEVSSEPSRKNRKKAIHYKGLDIIKAKSSNTIAVNSSYSHGDSFIFFIPTFTEINKLKKRKRRYLDEEKTQNTIFEAYSRSISNLGINGCILDTRIGSGFTTENYNRYCIASEWIAERFSWDTIIPGILLCNINMRNDSVLKSKNYVSAAAYNYIIHRRTGVVGKALIATMFGLYFVTPAILASYFVPQKDVYISNIILNRQTGNFEMIYFHNFNHRFTKDAINAHTYRVLYHSKNSFK